MPHAPPRGRGAPPGTTPRLRLCFPVPIATHRAKQLPLGIAVQGRRGSECWEASDPRSRMDRRFNNLSS